MYYHTGRPICVPTVLPGTIPAAVYLSNDSGAMLSPLSMQHFLSHLHRGLSTMAALRPPT